MKKGTKVVRWNKAEIASIIAEVLENKDLAELAELHAVRKAQEKVLPEDRRRFIRSKKDLGPIGALIQTARTNSEWDIQKKFDKDENVSEDDEEVARGDAPVGVPETSVLKNVEAGKASQATKRGKRIKRTLIRWSREELALIVRSAVSFIKDIVEEYTNRGEEIIPKRVILVAVRRAQEKVLPESRCRELRKYEDVLALVPAIIEDLETDEEFSNQQFSSFIADSYMAAYDTPFRINPKYKQSSPSLTPKKKRALEDSEDEDDEDSDDYFPEPINRVKKQATLESSFLSPAAVKEMGAVLSKHVTQMLRSSMTLIVRSAVDQVNENLQNDFQSLKDELMAEVKSSFLAKPELEEESTVAKGEPKTPKQRVIVLGPWSSMAQELKEYDFGFLDIIHCQELSEVRRSLTPDTVIIQLTKRSAHLPKDIKKKAKRIDLATGGKTDILRRLGALNVLTYDDQQKGLV